jgi:hypothetical protein
MIWVVGSQRPCSLAGWFQEWWLHVGKKIGITRKRGFVYIAIITAAGLLIDSLYYALTWGTLVIGSLRIPAIFERPGA